MNEIPKTQQECWEIECNECALYDLNPCHKVRRNILRYYKEGRSKKKMENENEVGCFADWVIENMQDDEEDKFVIEEWLYGKVREWYEHL